MIILVVIVVGVVILVVFLRAKKRKQQLVIIKLKSITAENEDIEMMLKQEGSTKKGPNSSADQPPYAEIQTVVPPTRSEKLRVFKPKQQSLVSIVKLNRNQTVVRLFSLQSLPDKLTSQIPHPKKLSPVMRIKILTNTPVSPVYKKPRSTLFQKPPTHTQMRPQVETMRQCIVSQSSLHSSLMQFKLPVILKICSLMPPFTLSPSTCQRVRKCY